MKVVHSDGCPLFPCETCGKSFKLKETFTKHVREAHEGKKSKIPLCCPICGKCLQEMSRHIKQVHNGIKIKCAQCEKTFFNKTFLNEHITIFHEGKKNANICNICQKTFSRSYDLSRHILGFHDQTPRFQCTVCLKNFLEVDKLNRHSQIVHKTVNVTSESVV